MGVKYLDKANGVKHCGKLLDYVHCAGAYLKIGVRQHSSNSLYETRLDGGISCSFKQSVYGCFGALIWELTKSSPPFQLPSEEHVEVCRRSNFSAVHCNGVPHYLRPPSEGTTDLSERPWPELVGSMGSNFKIIDVRTESVTASRTTRVSLVSKVVVDIVPQAP